MGGDKSEKKDKKDKKDKKRSSTGDDDDVEMGTKKQRLVSPIANPLADEKLTKKVLKAVKAAAEKKMIRRGVKEVVKALKKGEKGLTVVSDQTPSFLEQQSLTNHCTMPFCAAQIAGDISPVEVIAHVPIFCEEKDVAYIYVPSKEDLGLASLTKRPTSIVMVRHGADLGDAYAECESGMRAALPKFK